MRFSTFIRIFAIVITDGVNVSALYPNFCCSFSKGGLLQKFTVEPKIQKHVMGFSTFVRIFAVVITDGVNVSALHPNFCCSFSKGGVLQKFTVE